jgi:hypothetical protein
MGHQYDGIKPLVATRKLSAGGAIFEEQTEESEVALFKGVVTLLTGRICALLKFHISLVA